MRELLLAFILALILGSIINGMPPPTKTAPAPPGQSPLSTTTDTTNIERRDYPDFASFIAVDGTNFESQVLKSEKPVFIDCYVPNNTACDQMLPLVAALGKEHADSIVMAKMNLMDNIVLAHQYELSSVPTFLLFNKGVLVNKLIGVLPQDRLESMVATINQSASSLK